MTITYDLTVELKGDLGFSSCDPLYLHSVDELKEQLYKDYSSEDYRMSTLDITFNEQTILSFSYPCRVEVFSILGDAKIRVVKCDMHIPDIIHNLVEYANYH